MRNKGEFADTVGVLDVDAGEVLVLPELEACDVLAADTELNEIKDAGTEA